MGDPIAMALLTGLLGGFGHCIGMCGPLVGAFALASGSLGPRRSMAGQLAYHAGRVTTYASPPIRSGADHGPGHALPVPTRPAATGFAST